MSPDCILNREMSDSLRLLIAFYAERARLYYDRAAVALPDSDRRRLRPAEAMGRIYLALLTELQNQRFPVFERVVRLSRARRVAIAASVWLGRDGR